MVFFPKLPMDLLFLYVINSGTNQWFFNIFILCDKLEHAIVKDNVVPIVCFPVVN